MNYNALAASNGAGEAVRATVQSPRAVGSTTITVNATTNWPTGTFIATTGTLQSNGTLNPATVQVFYGTALGTTITITSFAAGYSDLGNAINDVVVLKPSTEWANIVANALQPGGSVLQTIYPVGSIYTSTVSTNPATLFGFGTWVAYAQGRVLVGVGTSDETFTAGAIGGESNHTLSVAELAAHNHGVADPGHTHGETVSSIPTGGTLGINGTSGYSGANGSDLSTEVGYTGISTTNNGSGTAHNNLQPYIVVYIWNRTA